MASTNYSKTISTDFANGKVDVDKLSAEITASSIVTALDRIDTAGDTCDIWFKSTLSSGDQTTLNTICTDHDGSPAVPAATLVKVEEESNPTGGHYRSQSWAEDVPTSTGWHDLITIQCPIPMNILSADFYVRAECDKDEIDVCIAPDTIIGAITANVAAAATVIDVQQSVIDNIQVGYFVKLDDGTNADDCGQVLVVDDANNKITVETATTNSFQAGTPTYVKMTVKMIPQLELTSGHRVTVGESKIGGSYITANTPIEIRYNSKDGLAKRFSFIMEYLY